MQVVKFGPVAVSTAPRIETLVRIVAQAREYDPAQVVVCTALPGMTNALITAARTASHGEDSLIEVARRDLWSRHRALAEKLVDDEWERESLFREWADLLRIFDRVTRAIATLGDPSPRAIDAVASLGERFISHLLAVVLRIGGVPAREIDAAELIVTDDHFGAAHPILDESAERLRARIIPMGQAGIIPVVTGYIGATRDGIVTTLGRGGGDYTAAFIGEALGADEVCIWTDVPGILTADPKIVRSAGTLPELSYAEAAEIAAYGPEVLHPRTIEPVARQGITLRIRDVLRPELEGTRIIAETSPTASGARAIISARDLSHLTIAATGSAGWAPDLATRALSRLNGAGVEILTVAQNFSDQSLSLAVRAADAPYAHELLASIFARELASGAIHPITSGELVALIAVIGAPNGEELGPRVLHALGEAGAHIFSLVRGSTSHHVAFLLPDHEVKQVLPPLHRALRLG